MLEGIKEKRRCERQSAIVGNQLSCTFNHFLSSSPEPGISSLLCDVPRGTFVNFHTLFYVILLLLQGCGANPLTKFTKGCYLGESGTLICKDEKALKGHVINVYCHKPEDE